MTLSAGKLTGTLNDQPGDAIKEWEHHSMLMSPSVFPLHLPCFFFLLLSYHPLTNSIFYLLIFCISYENVSPLRAESFINPCLFDLLCYLQYYGHSTHSIVLAAWVNEGIHKATLTVSCYWCCYSFFIPYKILPFPLLNDEFLSVHCVHITETLFLYKFSPPSILHGEPIILVMFERERSSLSFAYLDTTE